MHTHSVIRTVSLAAAMACLALAYVIAGYWQGLLAIPVTLLAWMLAQKWSAFWAASSALTIYLSVSVIGILLRVPVLLLIPGCLAAIAWWDLAEFDESLVGEAPAKARALLEKQRLQSLGLMVGTSLVLEAVGLWLRLQLPFGVVMLLALLSIGGILYSAQWLRLPG